MTGRAHAWWAFLAPKLRQLAEFLTKQGLTLAGTLLYGLLCVRMLPVDEYARFTVVFGVQGTLVLLMDIGITNSLIPLVGEQVGNRRLIADYLASLRQVAHWIFALVAPATAIAYPLLVRNRGWGWQEIAAMLAILIVSAWFARVSAAYGAVLIILRDRKHWYRARMAAAAGALILLLILRAAHWFNAYSAMLISVCGIIFIGASYYRRAGELLGVRGEASAEKRAAIMHLTLPTAPGVIFYAVQGQIALLLITIFGRTAGVAGVGALSRLAQLFALFVQAVPVLVEPYFAKLGAEKVRSHYVGALAAAASLGASVTLAAHLFPGLFLWILGPNYAGYRFEVQLVMLSGAIALLSGLMASVNVARRFAYYWHNLFIIVATVLVQVLFITKVDLSTVRNALWFNVACGGVFLLAHGLCSVYGFVRGPRSVKAPDAVPCEEDVYV